MSQTPSQTPAQLPSQPRKRSLLSASRPWVAFAFIGATAGMLIWSKLRLVSGLPRSAYAVPEARIDADPNATAAVQSAPSDAGNLGGMRAARVEPAKPNDTE